MKRALLALYLAQAGAANALGTAEQGRRHFSKRPTTVREMRKIDAGINLNF